MFRSKNQFIVIVCTLFIIFLLVYFNKLSSGCLYELKVLNDLQYFSFPFLTKLGAKQYSSTAQIISMRSKKKLHPWWVTGYTDGEGCFLINTIKAKTTKTGYTVKLIYQVSVHPSDEAILHYLKAFFNNVGRLTYSKHYIAYRVEHFSDIRDVIIPHFSTYPLQSTKFISFYLFKAAADIINKKEHLTIEGYSKLLSYKAAFKKGLAASIFQSDLFSNVIPFNTEGVFIEKSTTLVPEYISGFVAADGSFFISRPSVNAKWPNYDATFSIAQNQRDEGLLNRIIKTLGCGSIKKDNNGMRHISVRNKLELYTIIVPFFTKYLINTEKAKDFDLFSIAVSILYANKGKGLKNLTEEHIKQLDCCISSMNKNRYSPKISNIESDI